MTPPLLGAPGVVEQQELIQIGLNLLDGRVPLLPTLDAEVLIEQRAVHTLDKAVGARTADLGVAMLDILQGRQQLVRMALGLAAELAAVVCEDGLDRPHPRHRRRAARAHTAGHRPSPASWSFSTWQRPGCRTCRSPPAHGPCPHP